MVEENWGNWLDNENIRSGQDDFKRMLQREKGVDYFRCTSCKWNNPRFCYIKGRPLIRWTERCDDFESKT